jgi:hypothetical protein
VTALGQVWQLAAHKHLTVPRQQRLQLQRQEQLVLAACSKASGPSQARMSATRISIRACVCCCLLFWCSDLQHSQADPEDGGATGVCMCSAVAAALNVTFVEQQGCHGSSRQQRGADQQSHRSCSCPWRAAQACMSDEGGRARPLPALWLHF